MSADGYGERLPESAKLIEKVVNRGQMALTGGGGAYAFSLFYGIW